MESKEFIKQALKTEYVPDVLPITEDTLANALIMAIACTKMMDQLKKLIIYGKGIDILEFAENQKELINFAKEFAREICRSDAAMSVPITNDNVNIRLLHAAIGIFTESGEMLDALLSQLAGEGLDKVNLAEEAGDVDWYKAIAIDELGIPEGQIRQILINKLAKRYPEKFTSEAALNRDLDAERKTLEEGLKC